MIIQKATMDKWIGYSKGFSILAIVLFHLISIYCNTLPPLIRKASVVGGFGIFVFFLCSGYGLYYSRLSKPCSAGEYLKKRVKKVYLPYIIIILVTACIPFTYMGTNHIAAVCSHVFLYKMFFEEFIQSFGVQMWYVSTIFQFYFLFPLLCRIKARIGGKMLLLVSVVLSAVWMLLTGLFSANAPKVWYSCFLTFLWIFVIGMLLAEKYMLVESKFRFNFRQS